MDSRLWSELLIDVITSIMKHAPDTSARKNWLKATVCNVTLYRQAVRAYHRHFILCHENILRGSITETVRYGKDAIEVVRAVRHLYAKHTFI